VPFDPVDDDDKRVSPMGEEEQEFLEKLAAEFVTILEDAEKALARKIDAQMFDVDEYAEFWSLIPAKVKTAIKRGNAQPGTTCAECRLTGTHTRHCSIGGKFA
jgi:hypothetical protein